MRVHLFPSRTQKLSSFAPTILGGRLPGKIGNANTSLSRETGAFFCLKRATGTFLNGMRPRHFLRCTLAAIPDLSGKLDNANRMPDGKIGAFFCLKHATGMFFTAGQYLAYPERSVMPTCKSQTKVWLFFYACDSPPDCCDARTIRWPTREDR